MNNKCVYIHKSLDGIPFYVGCGDKDRPYNIYRRSKKWKEYANKGYTVEIFKDNISETDAFLLEYELIKKYGKLNDNTGILVNKNLCYKQNIQQKGIKVIDYYNDLPIIDYKTNMIFQSVEEASQFYKKNINTLIRHLKGIQKINLTLKYLE